MQKLFQTILFGINRLVFQEKPGKYPVSGKLKAPEPVPADEIEAMEQAGQKKLKLAQPEKHPFDAREAKTEKPVALQPRTLEEARNWLKSQKVLVDNGMDPSKEFLALIGLKKPTDNPLFSFGKEKIITAIKKLQRKVRVVDDGVLGRVTYLAVLNKYPDQYADARFAALGLKPETKTVAGLGKRPERKIVDLNSLGDERQSLLAAAEKHSMPDVQHESTEEKLARNEWRKARKEKEKIAKELDAARKTDRTADTMALEARYAAAEKAEIAALERGARAQREASLRRHGAAGADAGPK